MGPFRVDFRRLFVVARFELAESLRSRRVLVILIACAATAAAGAYAVARALDAAQRALQAPQAALRGRIEVPQVTTELLHWAIDDRALADELAALDPLAVCYGVLSSTFVALLVLVASGTVHAQDVDRGATRFLLTRCDRWSWSLGKLAGHAALLAFGLAVGATVTALVGGATGHLSLSSVPWLARVSLCVWVYGLCYLGIFSGIALWSRRPSRARPLCVAVLFGLWFAHTLASSSLAEDDARRLAWLFPTHYQLRLWSPEAGVWLSAVAILLLMGASAFALGARSFERGDA